MHSYIHIYSTLFLVTFFSLNWMLTQMWWTKNVKQTSNSGITRTCLPLRESKINHIFFHWRSKSHSGRVYAFCFVWTVSLSLSSMENIHIGSTTPSTRNCFLCEWKKFASYIWMRLRSIISVWVVWMKMPSADSIAFWSSGSNRSRSTTSFPLRFLMRVKSLRVPGLMKYSLQFI